MTLDELRHQRDQLRALAERHGARRLRVFGSTARGDAGPDSDIDFLVDMAPGRSLLDLGALQLDLSDALGRHVDIVTENGLRPPLKNRVLAEAQEV